MTNHPDAGLLERFRLGKLSGQELLATDDHLGRCNSCRRTVADSAMARVAVRQALETLDGDHLSFEELSAYVDGLGDADERTAAGDHLEVCAMCRAEAADLGQAVRVVAVRARFRGFAIAAAIAAFVAGGAALVWNTASPEPEPHRGVESVRRAPATVPLPRDSPPALAPAPATASDRNPLEQLPPSLRRVATALQRGTLASANLVASLQGTAGGQRSAGAVAPGTAALLGPVGVVLEADRPAFRWSRDDSTQMGVVQVFDSRYNRVLESPALKGTAWTSPTALKRGVTYQWQVVLRSGSGEKVLPPETDPPARFRLLTAEALAELQAARRSGSDLEQGLICMREGLFDEGARRLAAFAEAHPGTSASALAKSAWQYAARF
ncbi:MAG TPA: hypothetical protein VE974_11050 [Thermoanaerobaculia bacterium]|nr:hypothetical protein [Thermoanaerobaculia bacterium]